MPDTLRPPPPLDPARARYKDWLHLNVFDHAGGSVGLFNGSLHGAPEDARSRVIGTALVHHPALGWLGNTEVAGFDTGVVTARGIALAQVAVALAPSGGTVHAAATFAGDGVVASLAATPQSAPLDVDLPLPFGEGWISWRVVPSLALEGRLSLGGDPCDLGRATAYHDHNWGRWRWGDDVGWEWGAFASAGDGETIVVSRTTDREHSTRGPALVTIDRAGRRRAFAGSQADVTCAGRFDGRLRRIPGALAALHGDRAHPSLPERVVVSARDGFDALELTFTVRAAAQLVAAEPTRRGYSFIHELVGAWQARRRGISGSYDSAGLGVFEWVS